jgi:hypothetical protein
MTRRGCAAEISPTVFCDFQWAGDRRFLKRKNPQDSLVMLTLYSYKCLLRSAQYIRAQTKTSAKITPTLKSSRERDDHRPDGDDTDCLRSASSCVLNASSRSSPQGGGTRLSRLFIKISGTEGQPSFVLRAAKRETEQYRARVPSPAGRRAGG